MPPSFPLQTVLDLMQVRADDAAKALGQLIASEQDAASRLRLLENYRDEYAARFREAASNGLSPQQWANFQDFSGRIELAIEQQRGAVDMARVKTRAGQQQWVDQNRKVQAFDTLAQKHGEQVRHQEERQQQKLSDEFSSRKHFNESNS